MSISPSDESQLLINILSNPDSEEAYLSKRILEIHYQTLKENEHEDD
jgi:hypothetical protein